MRSFDNPELDLYVVITMTNWSEPPRFRHEISRLLSKNNNVLFLQLHSQRLYKRKAIQISSNLIVDKVGFSLPGLTRLFWTLPYFRFLYYSYISKKVMAKIKEYKHNKLILFNFQYDFPEIMNIKLWDYRFYFCNDDFIAQHPAQFTFAKHLKKCTQRAVVLKSDMVITVSKPLKSYFENFSKNVRLLYSGHRFNIKNALDSIDLVKKEMPINVCYLGVFNSGIALSWLQYLLKQKDITLTVIGPLPKSIKSSFSKYPNFIHAGYLIDTALQNCLLKQDVLLMPYVSNAATEMGSVPAKLFQYLAVGKPIVSSALTNIIELPTSFIYMAKNKEDFYIKIKKSFFEHTEELARQRISFASKNTWDDRGIQLQEYIDEVLGN